MDSFFLTLKDLLPSFLEQRDLTAKMTSYFSQHGRLRQETMYAYERWGRLSQNLAERLAFIQSYLEDVIPDEIGIIQIPDHCQPVNISQDSHGRGRTEIDLLYPGKYFMIGIVSMDNYHPRIPAQIATALAINYWREGLFVEEPHEMWRTFTVTACINFYGSRDGDHWGLTGTFQPIAQVHEVVRHLQYCFERVRSHN